MQSRRPSTARTAHSLIRRRASAATNSPLLNVPAHPEFDAYHAQDTIILRPVQTASSPPLPTLPQFDFEQPDGEREACRTTRLFTQPTHHLDADARPEPGRSHTQRNDLRRSFRASASHISRLPTPSLPPVDAGDISPLSPRGESSTRLSRAWSFLSLRAPSLLPLADFGLTAPDDGKTGGASASDFAHRMRRPTSIPPIVSDKFTQRWPAPLQVRRRGKAGLGLELALGNGPGVDVNIPERWTNQKWCLLLSVSSVFVYGGAGLVYAILTWFRAWDLADVMYVADGDILILITFCGSILLFTALLGAGGTLLNSRLILAIYALLLWPCLISLLAIGYASYKRSTFALDRKLNLAWSQWYTPAGRLMVQDALRCCGFYSALHGTVPSSRCYSRTPLPGCKGKLLRFEARNLPRIWSTVFSLAPLHLVNIAVSLLCANHVTERFGKGLMPKRYRLRREDLQADNEAEVQWKIGKLLVKKHVTQCN